MALNVIMMGPPGAGKGTQALLLAEKCGLQKISTGDILREAVSEGTPLGLKAKAVIDSGELVDNATMIGIVRERLLKADVAEGFVLDGFPRTVSQAKALDGIKRDSLIIVAIEVPDDDLLRRMTTRRVCQGCGRNADPAEAESLSCPKCGGDFTQRTDDNIQVIKERLKVYARDTEPLLDYYNSRQTFCLIDGTQSPGRVSEMLLEAIKAVSSTDSAAITEPGQRVESQ
jgi:adenylate kinase